MLNKNAIEICRLAIETIHNVIFTFILMSCWYRNIRFFSAVYMCAQVRMSVCVVSTIIISSFLCIEIKRYIFMHQLARKYFCNYDSDFLLWKSSFWPEIRILTQCDEVLLTLCDLCSLRLSVRGGSPLNWTMARRSGNLCWISRTRFKSSSFSTIIISALHSKDTRAISSAPNSWNSPTLMPLQNKK